jgi:hypothetical protein
MIEIDLIENSACSNYITLLQLGRIEPPEETGFWGLGEWDQTEMENPWRAGTNKKMAPFDEKVIKSTWSQC